jgi:hypothetical protein
MKVPNHGRLFNALLYANLEDRGNRENPSEK